MATNSAPALSPDLGTLYVAVNANPASGTVQGGYLLALDSTTLALRNRALLIDPGSGTLARVSDDSTASPTVGPDGDVYFGVLETVFGTHNGRGWLLHYDATLATRFTPGGFGWDDTASVVPTLAGAVVHRQLAVPVDGQVQQLPRRRLPATAPTGWRSSIRAPPRSTRSPACRS